MKIRKLVTLFIVLLVAGLVILTSTVLGQRVTPTVPSEEVITRQHLVLTALGEEEADLIIRGASVLDVHTLTWKHDQEVVIKGERIAWVGSSNVWPGQAKEVVDVYGLYAVPGFGESHKHIESSHLTPEYEAALVLPDGTTWIAEASHEFGNVTGEHNVEFWLMAREAGIPLKIFPQLGSAIPPTPFEFTGGYYGYEEIKELMEYDPWVIGLGEVMDWPSVWNPEMPGYKRMWEVIQATWDSDGVVEGHGSRMFAVNDINAFAAAGLSSDHSVREGPEAWDKITRGIFLQLKPGCMPKVIPYLKSNGIRDWSNIAVTTDDRDADDSLQLGTMDYNIRVAIDSGVPVEVAYAMGSLYPARHWHLEHLVGSIAPGRYADIVLLREPETVDIAQVYANGRLVAKDGEMVIELPKIDWPDWATDTMNIGRNLTVEDFIIQAPQPDQKTVTVALLEPFYFAPEFMTIELPVVDGVVQPDLEGGRGISKFAIVDRYHGTGAVAKMFWQKVGPKTSDTAVASSVAHDHHNIWVLGSSDRAMALAANRLAEIGGGWVLVSGGEVIDEVLYEVGGLMSARPPEEVADDLVQFWVSAEKFEWLGTGVPQIKRQIFATLTCQPWKWVLVAPFEGCPSGFVNVTNGECNPIVW